MTNNMSVNDIINKLAEIDSHIQYFIIHTQNKLTIWQYNNSDISNELFTETAKHVLDEMHKLAYIKEAFMNLDHTISIPISYNILKEQLASNNLLNYREHIVDIISIGQEILKFLMILFMKLSIKLCWNIHSSDIIDTSHQINILNIIIPLNEEFEEISSMFWNIRYKFNISKFKNII